MCGNFCCWRNCCRLCDVINLASLVWLIIIFLMVKTRLARRSSVAQWNMYVVRCWKTLFVGKDADVLQFSYYNENLNNRISYWKDSLN